MGISREAINCRRSERLDENVWERSVDWFWAASSNVIQDVNLFGALEPCTRDETVTGLAQEVVPGKPMIWVSIRFV